jgi:hypothetical protein
MSAQGAVTPRHGTLGNGDATIDRNPNGVALTTKSSHTAKFAARRLDWPNTPRSVTLKLTLGPPVAWQTRIKRMRGEV